jgi:hypothetical protein
MKLKDLIGKHKFSGIDFNSESIKNYADNFEDCQVVNFILDGKTYTAIEDPDDGYRSCMKEIKEGTAKIKNTFASVQVLGIMKPDGDYNKNDILQLYNISNGKIVFEVGTENTDDYYPCWVASFTPENI